MASNYIWDVWLHQIYSKPSCQFEQRLWRYSVYAVKSCSSGQSSVKYFSTESCWNFWWNTLKCHDFPHSLARQFDIIVALSFISAKYHIPRLLYLKHVRTRTSLQQLSGYLLSVSYVVLHGKDCTFIFDAFKLIFCLCRNIFVKISFVGPSLYIPKQCKHLSRHIFLIHDMLTIGAKQRVKMWRTNWSPLLFI